VERSRILEETRQEMKRQIELLQAEIRQARSKLRDAASLNSGQAAEQAGGRPGSDAGDGAGPGAGRDGRGVAKGKRRSLQVGDLVQVRSLNVKGEVISIGKNEVVVAVGRLQMRAGYDDLEFKERPVRGTGG
jgi:hypothetical protein